MYKSIYNFCNENLSSFYLDILKDRLYTSSAESIERRSAQTVLYHILNHIVRLLAPILSFTADEIFGAMPKDKDTQDVKSVHLLSWLEVPEIWNNPAINEKYKFLVALRPQISKSLENKRSEGLIGSSLEAKIIINTSSEDDFNYLKEKQDFLATVFIVSSVEVNYVQDIVKGLNEEFSKIEVRIEKADGQKCMRCWNFKIEVGKNTEHSMLCARCAEIVKELK